MPFTSKPGQIAPNCGGYCEWLPANYTPTKKYPLLLFFHGLGELGNGTTDLIKIGSTGLPNNIKNQGFPYEMVVVMPQFGAWPGPEQTTIIIDYALKTYSIDPNRIYVTGLSMGGGATWDLAGLDNRIAAIAPICGASGFNSAGANKMVANNLAVWGFHAKDDGVVSVSNTNGWVDGLNALKINPVAQKTIYNTGGHNIWGMVYDYSYKIDGVSTLYEWLLKYSKSSNNQTGSNPPTSSSGTSGTTGTSGTSASGSVSSIYKITTAPKPLNGGWVVDVPFIKYPTANDYSNESGTMVLFGVTKPITNTTEQEVYQYERWTRTSFNYELPVSNGEYTVILHFAELWHNAPGKRVFNVNINNNPVLTNYDIFADAKAKFVAVKKSFNTTVTNGKIVINFKTVVDGAKVTAVEVVPVSSTSGTSGTTGTSGTSGIPSGTKTINKILVTEYRDVNNALIKSTTEIIETITL